MREHLNLMRSYHAYVHAIVVGVVDNSHDAEEVVQDAFLSAYRGLRQLEDTTKFKVGWQRLRETVHGSGSENREAKPCLSTK